MLQYPRNENNFETEIISSANLNEKMSADLSLEQKQNHLSRKKIQFNKLKHRKTEWITAGILK